MKTRRRLTPTSFFQGLARELDLLAPVYARLRAAHPELSPYPTLPSLLARLTVGPRDAAKSELLAALVSIRQSAPHRLWVALLLRAFRPMLRNLWKTLFGSDAQERLALLLVSFQGALLGTHPSRDPLRVAMYVRQGTRRRVFVALSKELTWTDVGFGEEADTCADPRGTDARGGRRSLEPFLRGSVLKTYVRRAHPTLSPEEQARVYQRLRRRLRRALNAPTLGLEEGTVTL
jgi:hypothetical protein